MSHAFCILLFSWLMAPAAAPAQTSPSSGGVIDGFVSTQAGTIRLAGAQLSVRDAQNRQVATTVAEGDGHFVVAALPEGAYRVSAALAGFETTSAPAAVIAGRVTTVTLDLPIASISQTVEVVGSTTIVSSEGTLAQSSAIGSQELEQYAPGGGFQAALRLLAGIIEVPGGVSIKGGRPSQASVQLGPGTLVDPSTGLTRVSLPDDAIDSVAVLPNPYAVEYGRFSSGLVVIQTRRAGDHWKTRFNNLDPAFRTKRGTMFDITGIGLFAPRFETGGPILKDRLFIEQTAQFRYSTSDVASRPEDELKTTKWFGSFTRVDANLSSRHSLVATGGLFPSISTLATLGTFIPPDASADIKSRVNHAGVTERALWSDSIFSETTVQVHDYRTDVLPQGAEAMRLLPDTTLGNFYNTQHRSTATYQLVEALSGSHNKLGGLHLFKAGFDFLYNRYDGTSASRPVLIERADGTLARRLDFAGESEQAVRSSDVALFVQDRFQPNARWYLEFGGRLDRDGIVDRFNLTPRMGTAVLLNTAGTAVLRGGFGLFYERTPSTVGAFDQFETAVDTRFARDGVTPLGPPVRWVHVTTPNLDTPRSRTWDVGYDHRLNSMLSIHAAVIGRTGDHELIVEPGFGLTQGDLLLTSTGRSSYREFEAGFHFTTSRALDVNASYTRSVARGDLNALSNYFDSVMSPIIDRNAYAMSNGDVPHRLLARGRAMPTPRWLVLGTVDWRTGMPWSAVNDTLDFVGPRNDGRRFPNYARVALGVERRVKILGLQPWIGIRADNAFKAFLPIDVQPNTGSPHFGTFYNSEFRQMRLQFRFER
jgi:carboxypeptidase family protein/TonB-dependent receptor-like protein